MQTIAHLTVATMVLGIAFVVAVLVVAALCIIALRLGTAFQVDLQNRFVPPSCFDKPQTETEIYPDHIAAGRQRSL